MRQAHQKPTLEVMEVRVLGRGLGAQRGVHLTMRALRDAAGRTQGDVAADSEMDQADVSRLESRADFDDCQVATIRRYVATLGGELELVAAFGNKRIILTGLNLTDVSGLARAKKASQRTGRKAARR
jgi:hypothetical protein